jgi:hypothetical protein
MDDGFSFSPDVISVPRLIYRLHGAFIGFKLNLSDNKYKNCFVCDENFESERKNFCYFCGLPCCSVCIRYTSFPFFEKAFRFKKKMCICCRSLYCLIIILFVFIFFLISPITVGIC